MVFQLTRGVPRFFPQHTWQTQHNWQTASETVLSSYPRLKWWWWQCTLHSSWLVWACRVELCTESGEQLRNTGRDKPDSASSCLSLWPSLNLTQSKMATQADLCFPDFCDAACHVTIESILIQVTIKLMLCKVMQVMATGSVEGSSLWPSLQEGAWFSVGDLCITCFEVRTTVKKQSCSRSNIWFTLRQWTEC